MLHFQVNTFSVMWGHFLSSLVEPVLDIGYFTHIVFTYDMLARVVVPTSHTYLP